MAKIPLPHVNPYWEHAADEPPKWVDWKKRIDVLLALTAKLGTALDDEAKNQMLFAYLGAEGSRRFNTHPQAGEIATLSYDRFSRAAAEIFDTPTLPALAFHEFRTCKQMPHESVNDFVTGLRTLQADCDYANFNADVDLAYVLSQNCYNKESQKKLFGTKPVNLDVYVNLLQADESAAKSASQIRGESSNVFAVRRDSDRQIRARADIPQQAFDPTPERNQICDGCGRSSHVFGDQSCPAKSVKCNYCHQSGHFKNCCFKKKYTDLKKKPGPSFSVQSIKICDPENSVFSKSCVQKVVPDSLHESRNLFPSTKFSCDETVDSHIQDHDQNSPNSEIRNRGNPKSEFSGKAQFKLHDVVCYKLSNSVGESESASYSRPCQINGIVSKWKYLLSNGEVYNARNLRHCKPADAI